jgi:hypothetical protein
MSAPVSRPFVHPQRFGRLWWLPSSGEGNGLDDVAWAPIADISAALVAPLLAAFRGADVPAYAAPAGRPLTRPPGRAHMGRSRIAASRSGQHLRRARTAIAQESYHIWVGTSGYARAEEVLRTELPGLLRREDHA